MKSGLLIVLNTGLDNPARSTRAFQMAKIAAEKGIDVVLFLVDDAVFLAKKGIAENVKAPTGDELKTYLQFLVENNVPIFVCKPCASTRQIKEDELIANARIETGYTLIDLTMERKVLCF